MLRFEDTIIPPEREPPRPAVSPRRRVTVLRTGAVEHDETFIEDWGLQRNSFVRFVSSDTQGLLTASEVQALTSLYEAGGAFTLETDLLSPLGEPPVTYAARWDPDSVPLFTPAEPGGRWYYFDVALIL